MQMGGHSSACVPFCLEGRNPPRPIGAAALKRKGPIPGELKQTGLRRNEEQNTFREISSGAKQKNSYTLFYSVPSCFL